MIELVLFIAFCLGSAFSSKAALVGNRFKATNKHASLRY